MIKRWPPRKTLTARNSPQICLCKVDSIYGIVADVVDVRTDHMTFRKISKKVVSVDSWALFFLWCPYSCGVFLWTDASHMNIAEQICTNLTGKIDGGCIFVLSRRHWECLTWKYLWKTNAYEKTLKVCALFIFYSYLHKFIF